jgi:hypothetical protein
MSPGIKRPPKGRPDPSAFSSYEFSNIYLDKYGLKKLTQEDFNSLNKDAFGSLFLKERAINLFNLHLRDDLCKAFPEILNSVSLYKCKADLIHIKKINGALNLGMAQIKKFPNLEEVNGGVNLSFSGLIEFPMLKSVGFINLKKSKCFEFPVLENCNSIIVYDQKEKEKLENYFQDTGRRHLAEKVEN